MAKIGIEVEGRFCGLKSLFVDADEVLRNDAMNVSTDVMQIYISDHNNKLDLNALGFLSRFFNVITVERTWIEGEYPEYVNVILCIENSSFWRLHRNCQIKFSKDMHVHAVTKRNMTETFREEFEGDITL